ncbi:hypothetical protein ACA758_01435 [Mycoplasmopsis agassizii]|uniref:hypothetical protein n=1 Tax=Mycoplasmopsis agassizii TaxID=33922 RepID=UPI00352944D9
MAELVDFGITPENRECIKKLIDFKYLDQLNDGARLGAALALRKKLYIGKNLMQVGAKMQLKTTWNKVGIDPENFFHNIVNVLELCPENVGIGVRSLIILGLDYIWEKIKDKDRDTISIYDIFYDE